MTETHREVPSWWRVALITSVVLNLFLLALIGGFLLRTRIHGRIAELSLARALANAEARLSAPDAAKFGAALRRDAPKFSEAAIGLAKARDELERQIAADPFDPQAARAAYAEWSARLNIFNHDIGDSLVDAASQISHDGRLRLLPIRLPEGFEHHRDQKDKPVP